MQIVRFVMQDTLRDIVETSVTAFSDMVLRACESIFKADSLSWPEGDLRSTLFKPSTSPLFSLQVKIDETSHRVVLSTPVGPFEEAVLDLLEAGIHATTGILQLEPQILKHLFWVGTPELETVAVTESVIEKAKSTVSKAIHKSIIPLEDYLSQYSR
jgi:dynein heavy chain